MGKDEVNYFGANPRVSGTVPGASPAVSASDNVIPLFGDELLGQPDAQAPEFPESYTRDNVPHGAWVEIDLDAIAHNVRLARKRIGPARLLMAVVKADAYGHGAVPVAKTALKCGANRLAVATVEEGVKLRRAGIHAPILVLSQPPQRTVPFLLEYDLTPTVCTADFALCLGEEADLRGRVASYHLAVDTGMNRIGVHYLDVVDFLRAINFHRGLRLEGVFTHFATADEEGDWNFRIQFKRFEEALQQLRDARMEAGIVHCANSACIERYPETYFDMVRLGITMYGLAPSAPLRDFEDLRCAMTVKGEVSFVKEPQMGEGVSYGMHYRVARPVQIATLPMGYADGLRRELSGRMKVIVNGRLCDQVGEICMDQMMVEVPLGHSVTGVSGGARMGDEAIILGRQGEYEITADHMADELGTINYEVVCGFGLRLPRVYVGGE